MAHLPQVATTCAFRCGSVRRGEDPLLYVANWPARRREHSARAAIARDRNEAWVLAVNRTGVDGKGVDYAGDSLVVDPWGRVVLDAGATPGVYRAVLAAETLAQCRRTFPVHLDADAFTVDQILSGLRYFGCFASVQRASVCPSEPAKVSKRHVMVGSGRRGACRMDAGHEAAGMHVCVSEPIIACRLRTMRIVPRRSHRGHDPWAIPTPWSLHDDPFAAPSAEPRSPHACGTACSRLPADCLTSRKPDDGSASAHARCCRACC